jgi:two-component system cell cycle sensor histidine kinase/response regulator CckA
MGSSVKKTPGKKAKAGRGGAAADGNGAAKTPARHDPTPGTSSYELMIGLSREPVLVADAASLAILACNEAAVELYGYSVEELRGTDLLSLSPDRERNIARSRLQRSARGKKEFHHIRKDGVSIFVEFDNVPVEYGGRAAYFCQIHDITTRSQLVRALLESDASNREIIENASDIIYTHDLQGNITSGNRAITRILGFTPEEYLNMNLKDVVIAEDLEKSRAAIQRKLAGTTALPPYSLRVRSKGGEVLTVEVSTRLIYKDGVPIGVQGIARDITDRQRVEAALRESEAKFRRMAETAPCSIIIYQDDRLVYVNPTTERFTGYSPAELTSWEQIWKIVAPEHLAMLRERAQDRLRGKKVIDRYEFKIIHRNGEERWLDLTANNIEYGGQPAGIAMIFDVTDRKRQEAELRASEERYRQLFQRNLAGVYLSTIDGRLLDCNDSLAQIYGYPSRDEILKQPAVSLYNSPEKGERFIRELRKAGSFTNLESPGRRRDGTSFWMLENVALIPGANGEPDAIFGTMIDITERKSAEQALRESEAKFRAVADTATSAIYIHDNERFLYVNRASEEISGYRSGELLGLSVFNLVHPEDRQLTIERARARQHGDEVPTRYEFRILTKDGQTRWLDFSATHVLFEGKDAILATAFDITERKRVEQIQAALYRIAERANSTVDLGQFFQSIHETVAELMYARNLFIALYDEGRDTLRYPYYVDEYDEPPTGDFPPGKGRTEYVLRTGQSVLIRPEDFERLAAAGEVEMVGSPCVDWIGAPLKSGQQCFGVIAVQSYHENIRYTDRDRELLDFVSQHLAGAILRKRNEDALRESEQRYRTMVQSAVYGIYRSDRSRHFLEVNPALVKMLGYDSAAEVLALDVSRDVYADADERSTLMQRYVRGGRIEGIEVRWKRRDGRLITVRLSGRAVLKPDGTFDSFEMIAEDVTERRSLEDQLRQSQKMEAVGRLAGGVAHDFNNLLTVIKGYTELMLEHFGESDPLRNELDEIRKAADRAAALTRQLLAFSRQQVLAPKVLDLNTVVSNMDKLLRRLLGADIDLQTRLDPQIGRIKADPSQIEQVIMNLAVNARDAMPIGGKLTILTANVDLDEGFVREHVGARPGSYVMVSVADTGVGMSEEVRQRIFEPFFTTKEAGKGTGLGLSTVYGIVKQSGGYVWVASELGFGTDFRVYLPRVDATADPGVSRQKPVDVFFGNETVLLVEDEDGVRALVRQVLQKHGYRVLEARNGGEALLHCERYEGEIELLLTDVVLEQMSGPELAKRLLTLRPQMKVLFISGYTDDSVLKSGDLGPGTAFLQKPFTTEALAKKIRHVLNG